MEYLSKFKAIKGLEDMKLFVLSNYQNFYDFFITQKYSELFKNKIIIEEALTEQYSIIKQLDFSEKRYKNFLSVILLACERLSLFALFERFYILFSANEDILYKLQAIAKYRIGCRRFEDYECRLDDILDLLQLAFENEEDGIESVTSVFVGYYIRVIYNFQHNPKKVNSFNTKIRDAIPRRYLLQQNIIGEVLNIDTSNAEKAFLLVQDLLDKYLNRSCYIFSDILSSDILLIEENSDYSTLLSNKDKSFDSIKNIATVEYKKIADDNVYYSLGRGTAILEDEKQLYAYLYSFGSTHYEKMKSALGLIDISTFSKDKSLEVIDWGCGQGLASVVLLELYPELNLQNIKLIEPSEVAIRRATLHIKHMNENILVKTICKPIELLEEKDVQTEQENIKIHLFSNILDVESFSIKKLIALFTNTQFGLNYFVCVSPYSTDIRNIRIKDFAQYFKDNKSLGYNLLGEIINSKTSEYWNCNNNDKGKKCIHHTGNGCEKRWTRYINVFSVNFA
jgi:hypothetical protein